MSGEVQRRKAAYNRARYWENPEKFRAYQRERYAQKTEEEREVVRKRERESARQNAEEERMAPGPPLIRCCGKWWPIHETPITVPCCGRVYFEEGV